MVLQEAEITFVFHTAVLVDVPELLHSQAVSFRAWSSSRTTSPREKVRRLTPIAKHQSYRGLQRAQGKNVTRKEIGPFSDLSFVSATTQMLPPWLSFALLHIKYALRDPQIFMPSSV